ncbi:MAG TPA: NAD(P)/FAD-dependent oxidoreductase, partial [Polyangiaceae bacterium]|nr:NAD(P)/FAD-dependent oxidoreductase [Polyangiaceae bacterium]
GDVGVLKKLSRSSQPLNRIALYVAGERAAELELPSPALAVPQNALEEALLGALRAEGVALKAPYQATLIEEQGDRARVRVTRRELVTAGSPALAGEWEPVESLTIDAEFVIGADGYDSRVRGALGIETVELAHAEAFAIFEFKSGGEPKPELGLVFDDRLGSALTPLPDGRQRWAFQVTSELSEVSDLARLRTLLSARAPWYDLRTDAVDWGTLTHFERRLARRFGRGRVWLAGDAAHVTSPFGAQSMNVGLHEACELSERIADCKAGKKRSESLEQYGIERQREWHKLLGCNVHLDVLPHAAKWLPCHARQILPALPASGPDLDRLLEQLGLVVR